MTLEQIVTLLLLPAAEYNNEDIDYIIENKPTLMECKHSELYSLSSYHLQLKKEMDGIEIPTREYVSEIVGNVSNYLVSIA